MPQAQRRKAAPKRTPTRTEIIRIPAPERPWELSEEQVTILKNSVCKGATDEELKYCLTVARRYRLDPFKQQIWFVPRNDKNADNPAGGKGMRIWTPTVGINGLLFAAARDHKAEFGSVSLPEFGPMTKRIYSYKREGKTFNKEIMAPAWARVKVWKKGEPAPTEAEAWWEEYAPTYLNQAPFWVKMPRRMLGKCATALAIRQAYPDLGGIFIPEESDRIGEDYTPDGRQITRHREETPVSPELDENARHGHAEGSRQASMAEAALKRVEEADAALAEERKAIQAEGGEKAPQIKPELQQQANSDIWPKSSAHSTTRRADEQEGGAEGSVVAAGDPAPLIMAGTIMQANPQSAARPRVDVLLRIDKVKHWLSAWDSALFPFLIAGKDKVAELYVEKRQKGDKTYTNIIGLKRIGAQRFEEDGRTPYTTTDREPGKKSLF